MFEFLFDILRVVGGVVGLEQFFVDIWESVRTFMERGGVVLTFIAWTLILMWVLIFERFMYFAVSHRKHVNAAMNAWESRAERTSWYARRVRELLVSEVSEKANASIPMIQALVALCPLLGLLGTVSGMIEVFQVLAISGSGNPRAMAAGVSKATIPTMSGMVAALSGLFLATWLQQKAKREVELLGEHLTMDH